MIDIFDIIFDISSLSAVIAAIAVVIGVVFAIIELRNLVKARQTSSCDCIRLP